MVELLKSVDLLEQVEESQQRYLLSFNIQSHLVTQCFLLIYGIINIMKSYSLTKRFNPTNLTFNSKSHFRLLVPVILLLLVVVAVTLFIQGGPFSYEAGIQRGPVSIKLITCYISTIYKIT